MDLKVVLFEDNDTRRNGLEMLINATENMTCVGAFEDCRNVREIIGKIEPDVVLMDIDMPHVSGIEGLIEIKKHFPDIKILMQTVFEDDNKIFAAICSGADGYILKKTSPSKLIDGIFEVVNGGAPMTPTIARQVLRLINDQNSKHNLPDFGLSPRELEILEKLVKGLSYKMIADEFNISYTTVNSHVKNIYKKLQVHSMVEAVTKAIKFRIV